MIGVTSVKAAEPHPRQQDEEDLFGGVSARREVVRGEHRECRRLAERLVLQPLGVQRRTQQPVLDPIPDWLWKGHAGFREMVNGFGRFVGEEHTISETSTSHQHHREAVKMSALL